MQKAKKLALCTFPETRTRTPKNFGFGSYFIRVLVHAFHASLGLSPFPADGGIVMFFSSSSPPGVFFEFVRVLFFLILASSLLVYLV